MPNDTLIGACVPALSTGTRSCPLSFFDSVRDVERDGAGLWVRHEPARTEHPPELAELAHLVWRGDQHVEVEPTVLDLLDELRAHVVGAGGLGLFGLVAGGDDEHADRLAGSGRENDGAAHDLIGVARIDAQTDGDLRGLVKLRECRFLDVSSAGGAGNVEAMSRFLAAVYFFP
jgi:hypothetical protein